MAWLTGAGVAHGAERTSYLLQTGGERLQSLEQEVFLEADGSYDFYFTFETDETATANFAHDSFTISLLGDDPRLVAVLLTTDIFGPSVAPDNPGGFSINPAWITITPVAASHPTTLTFSQSFAAHFVLPSELQGIPLRTAVDLFDNQNGVASRVHVTLAVPEPSTICFFALGLAALAAALAAARRRRL